MGGMVTITGTGFTAYNNQVKFTGAPAQGQITSSDGKTLTVMVPPSVGSPSCGTTFMGSCQGQPGTYQVVVTNSNGTSNAFNIVVTAATAPTVSASFAPATIPLGSSTMLSWSSSNAQYCSLPGDWSSSPANGTRSITPTKVGVMPYVVTCTSSGNVSASSTASVTVVSSTSSVTPPPVAPPAPTVSISLSQPLVTVGVSSIVTWTSKDAASCSVSGSGVNTTALAGTQAVTPTSAGSYPYAISCVNTANVKTSASATLTVVPPAQNQTNPVSITVSPTTITLGHSATVSWATTSGYDALNATVCSISGPGVSSKAINGSQSVTPSAVGADTYIIQCGGPAGSYTANATLTVNPAVVTPGKCSNSTAACQANQTVCTAAGSCSGGSGGSAANCSTAALCNTPANFGGCGGTWIPGCNGIWTPPSTSMDTSSPSAGNQTAIVAQSLQGLLDQLSSLLKSL